MKSGRKSEAVNSEIIWVVLPPSSGFGRHATFELMLLGMTWQSLPCDVLRWVWDTDMYW